MILSSSWDGIAGCSHQTGPHSPRISSSPPLHCACTDLFLFLLHLSTTDPLILVVLGASEGLGSSQECYAQPMLCSTRWGSSQASSTNLGHVAQVFNLHHKSLHPQMSVSPTLLDGETMTTGSHLRPSLCQQRSRQYSEATVVHATVWPALLHCGPDSLLPKSCHSCDWRLLYGTSNSKEGLAWMALA